MTTVFSPVAELTPDEIKRATEVTYLGTVYGTMSALRRMRRRGRGAIVNVGSALAYRSVPLQAAYCGAKSAIRGFTDSLRSEIIHDGDDIHLTMVHLPAVNTPQFDWAHNKIGKRPKPVPPIYEPEVPASAIVRAAFTRRRETWVGFSTVKAILANRVAAGFADRYLAKHGYSTQISDEPLPPDAPDNLRDTVDGSWAAHGRFDDKARSASFEVFTSRHKAAAGAIVLSLLGLAALQASSDRLSRRAPRV
jgi:NAD(P)-dependent dehydrogenase (short-subunit alcohol dehydrogenase family)